MNAISPQHAFAAALANDTRTPAGLRSVNDDSTAHRFAVHRNNVVHTLVDALADAFPVTQALVGEAFFRAMARERVYDNPPRSPVLIDYADGFADYIQDFAPAAVVPYLADIARIEALRIRAFHAADAVPVAAEAYRVLLASPERIAQAQVVLHPACSWLASRFAVHAIWRAHQGPGADLSAINIDRAEAVLITRPVFDVHVTLIPTSAIEFLAAVQRGEPLGAALTTRHAPATTPAHVHAGNGTDDTAHETTSASTPFTANASVAPAALLHLLIQHGLAVSLHSAANTERT